MCRLRRATSSGCSDSDSAECLRNPGFGDGTECLFAGDCPGYTGKIVAGLIGMVRDGTIKAHERVLFLHTGGMPSLFAYEDVLR